jgi:hypothetical protein
VTLLTSWTPPGTAADPHLPREAADTGPTAPAPVAPAPVAPAPVAPEQKGPASTPGRAEGRARRRAEQRAKAHQHRRDVLRRAALIAVPVLVVVAVIALVATLVRGGSGAAPTSDAAGRSQQTLLVQLVGGSGLAVNTALLGRPVGNADGSPMGLLLPSTLLTQAPGAGSVTMGETARLGDPATAGDAVADQFGVLVDGVWQVELDGLAQLVDGVGGIEVTVDREVLADSTVLLVPGPQRLDGLAAARYASYLADGEAEPSRSARFADVMTAWLAAAPTDVTSLTPLVAAPGAAAVSTIDATALADFLTALAVAARGDGLALSSAPVKPIDTGIDTVTYRLDREATADAVATRFAGSLPPSSSAGGGDVLVQNGVGTPGLGQAARERLVSAGFTFVAGGNASSFGRAATVVVIPDADPASRQQGRAVAAALGLPADAVRVAERGQSVADVVVILGRDFAP